jgi:hypothetical protein
MTFKDIIADLARPFAIYATAFSAAWATVVIAYKVKDGNDGAWALGAIGLTLSAIYAGKVIENFRMAASNAEVEKVRAQASPQPAEALKQPPPADERSLEDPA